MIGLAQEPAPKKAAAAAVPGAMVTVVGCISRQSVTPQPGTAPRDASAPSAQYVLTDQTPPAAAVGTPDGTATTTPDASGANPGTRGATAAGPQKPGRKMYVLRTEGTTVDFAPHVNHTVRVTGATTAQMTSAPLAGRSSEATPVPGSTAPAGATGTAFDTTNLPTLAVTTLAMVATTCK